MAISVLNTDAGLSGKTIQNLEDAQNVTGLKTFNRSPNAPFAVQAASAVVTNLDADKLDGQEGSYYTNASNLSSGTLPDARFPATLPAVSGANLTGITQPSYGTWTPVIGGSGGTSGQTYSKQQGTYVKIGRLVICPFYVQLSAEGTITGNAQIQGLPFTSDSSPADGHSCSCSWQSVDTGFFSLHAVVGATSTAAALIKYSGTALSSTNLTATEINDTTVISGTIIYRTA